MVYVLVRSFLHSPLGKGLAAFCIVSGQQLDERDRWVGLKLPAIVECKYMG